MKNNQWTDTERARLKKVYNTVDSTKLQVLFPGRSLSSITSQVSYLRKRGWTFQTKRDNAID